MPLRRLLPARAVVAMEGNDAFPAVWKQASGGQSLPAGESVDGSVVGLMVAYAKRRGWAPRDGALLACRGSTSGTGSSR
jgi:hypothetical protein